VAAAQLIVAGVGHHTHHPGAERPAAVIVQIAVSRQERRLRGIGGRVVIVQHAAGQVKGHLLVRQHQPVECIQITLSGGSNHCQFVHKEYRILIDTTRQAKRGQEFGQARAQPPHLTRGISNPK